MKEKFGYHLRRGDVFRVKKEPLFILIFVLLLLPGCGKTYKERADRDGLSGQSYDNDTTAVTQENVDGSDIVGQEQTATGKKVRVGYYTGDTAFQNGFDDDTRKSGYAYEYYQAIADLTGWYYEYFYGTKEEMLHLLQTGEADIVAGVCQTDVSGQQVLFSEYDMGLEGTERYFAVSTERSDLLDDLNYAMEQMSRLSPDFTVVLRQKYYSETARQILTEREKAWLAGKGVLKLGYVRHNLPLSEQGEDGEPIGVVRDLAKFLGEYLQVELEAVCYENVADLEDGLRAGEIDAAFPIYSDMWLNETKGFRQTDSFINDRVMIIYQGDYTDDMMEQVALSRTGVGQQYYMMTNYPDSRLTYYNSREAALDAILRGDERCIVGCSSILQRFLGEQTKYRNLNVAYLDTSETFGMAVNQENGLLAGSLNKAIRQWDDAIITASMMQYAGVNNAYTFLDFLRRYSLAVIMVMGFFFTVLVVLFVSYRRKTRIFNEEQEKSKAALTEALDVARVASKAKTTFLSSMSHDIRTPMNAIVGMTEIAARHLEDREKVKDCLEKIRLSGNHLLTLINDVLDISKIESGKLSLNPVFFSLRDTVATLSNIVRPQLRAKNIDFSIHIRGMEYETVYADEVRVNQVFINILTNAVKYTPADGKIVMDLAEETLPESQAVRLVYTVEDNGIGMSEEFMKNMYENFSRAKDSRINDIQGTGLGLSIVRQMVDMMGGTIDCQSRENVGTKFTVTLVLPVRERNADRRMLSGIRVLLVDDDEIFRESAKDAFEDIGISTDAAGSGAEAVELLRAKMAEPYSVIMVDWKMPGMSGPDTVKALRAIAGDDVPIAFVSAYDWADIEEEAQRSDVNGFISKPLFRSYIYEKMQELLCLEGEADTGTTERANDLAGMNLLVAEDNELNWEVISELLSVYGITADWARNGQICVEMLTGAPEGTYDIVLMDVQMPVLNGREAAKVIRQDEREYVHNIPIIALTADAFAEDIALSMEAGMNGHVSKPVDMDKLCQEIRRVLSPVPAG